MAVFSLLNCYVELNSVDHSDDIAGVELDLEGVELDVTNFGSGGWAEVLGGLKSYSLKIMWQQDFAATTVDDRLWALFNTVTTFEVRPTSASVGTTNPSFTGSVLVNELSPVSGSVGDLATMDVTWPGSGALTRATS